VFAEGKIERDAVISVVLQHTGGLLERGYRQHLVADLLPDFRNNGALHQFIVDNQKPGQIAETRCLSRTADAKVLHLRSAFACLIIFRTVALPKAQAVEPDSAVALNNCFMVSAA
jgi:hypothetical protein